MKKFIFTLIFMAMTGFAMNAQVADGKSDFEYRNGKFYQNATELTPEQLSYIIGQESYDNQYTPARKLRTAGVACLSAGCGVAAVGIGFLAYGIIDGNTPSGSAFGGMMAVSTGGVLSSIGAIAAITGGCLMGSASKKMKQIRPASSGVGLTFAF